MILPKLIRFFPILLTTQQEEEEEQKEEEEEEMEPPLHVNIYTTIILSDLAVSPPSETQVVCPYFVVI